MLMITTRARLMALKISVRAYRYGAFGASARLPPAPLVLVHPRPKVAIRLPKRDIHRVRNRSLGVVPLFSAVLKSRSAS